MRILLFLFVMTASLIAGPIPLTLRSRSKADGTVVETSASWETKKTAIIVCDMWDDHWCKSAARRVTELAGPMNEMLKAARKQGILRHPCA